MKKLCALIFAALILILPAMAEDEAVEDVFDENIWEAVETLASVDDVSSSVRSALLMERDTGEVAV